MYKSNFIASPKFEIISCSLKKIRFYSFTKFSNNWLNMQTQIFDLLQNFQMIRSMYKSNFKELKNFEIIGSMCRSNFQAPTSFHKINSTYKPSFIAFPKFSIKSCSMYKLNFIASPKFPNNWRNMEIKFPSFSKFSIDQFNIQVKFQS